MIHVTFMGHIKASMGRERMDIDKAGMSVEELFRFLKSENPAVQEQRHGFTEYNTLVVVNDHEALAAASRRDLRLNDGDSVLLVPFSHGG